MQTLWQQDNSEKENHAMWMQRKRTTKYRVAESA